MTARVHSRHSRIGAVFGLPGLLWWSLCGPVMAQAPTSAGIAQPATAPSISTARTPVIALATAPTHTGVHTSALPSEAPPGAAAAAQMPQSRPRIGLVLSGGGARGLAHVGVLQVLERARVPVDLVVGTSMGAIIGGLYASGMRADAIERELQAVRWDQVFASRVDRPALPQRRKEQDFELSTAIELGFRDGQLRLPQAAISGSGLESLLRRYTLPVRDVARFDALPIPFRAVATDMETGAAIELAEGDLAQALRSSMSVPGVFAPIERDGRILGDGGLVDNLPVALARRLGAQVVIAVNVGTPIGGRETLGSVVGLTAQMINILTEQNVQRSLALLQDGDVLISPVLGTLSSADFNRTGELILAGRAAAQAQAPHLAPLALPAPAYAQWAQGHRAAAPAAAPLTAVRFEGSTVTEPRRYLPVLESRPGMPFDPDAADRDARLLAASGDYLRTDYRLLPTRDGEALVFTLEDKPWGPDYLRLGLDLSTDFSGRSAFNLKLAHDRRWLTRSGAEWRNRLTLGDEPMLATEWWQPLGWTTSLPYDWFAAAWAETGHQSLPLYQQDAEIASFDRATLRLGVDIGQPWAALGEWRVGLTHDRLRTIPRLLGSRYSGPPEAQTTSETGPRARLVLDQLDYALFPSAGYRFEFEAALGRRRGPSGSEDFHRLHTRGTWVLSQGRHTLNAHLRASFSDESGSALVGRHTLGGFHELSGYRPQQLSGNHVLLGRLSWYLRLKQDVVLTRGFFFGASLEAGNAWMRASAISLADLRVGSSVFLGADTGVGPMYLGLTHAPRGSTGIMFFIGRP